MSESEIFEQRWLAEAEVKRLSAAAKFAEAEAKRLSAAVEAEEVHSLLQDDLLKRDHEYRMALLPHQTTRFWVMIVAMAVVSMWLIGAVAWA